MKKSLLVFGTLITLAACTDPFSRGSGASADEVANAQGVKGASYNQAMPILKTYCAGCHSGFSTYQGVASAVADIQATVFQKHTMPPVGRPQMSALEAGLLKGWLAAGAPPDALVTPTPTPDQTPLPATYTYIQTQILNAKCIKCHGPTSKQVHLTGYGDFFAPGAETIVRNQPELSPLFQVLEDGAKTPMPPKQAHMLPATAAEREAIRAWILNGAELN